MDGAFGFEKLDVYKKARAFRGRVYKLTRLLPPEERFGLAPQMRRAAVSVTNNLAEGYGRYTYRDRIHFCRESRGSVMEIADDLNVCEDEGYAKKGHLDDLRKDGVELLRLINGFVDYLRQEAKKRRAATTD